MIRGGKIASCRDERRDQAAGMKRTSPTNCRPTKKI